MEAFGACLHTCRRRHAPAAWEDLAWQTGHGCSLHAHKHAAVDQRYISPWARQGEDWEHEDDRQDDDLDMGSSDDQSDGADFPGRRRSATLTTKPKPCPMVLCCCCNSNDGHGCCVRAEQSALQLVLPVSTTPCVQWCSHDCKDIVQTYAGRTQRVARLLGLRLCGCYAAHTAVTSAAGRAARRRTRTTRVSASRGGSCRNCCAGRRATLRAARGRPAQRPAAYLPRRRAASPSTRTTTTSTTRSWTTITSTAWYVPTLISARFTGWTEPVLHLQMLGSCPDGW